MQGSEPQNARFILLIDHSEGYRFERRRKGKWVQAEPTTENDQKRITNLEKFRVIDTNSGNKFEIAVFLRPSKELREPEKALPQLHARPCDDYRAGLTPMPRVFALGEPIEQEQRQAFERSAFTGGDVEGVRPLTSHYYWRLVLAWSRLSGDYASNLVITRNLGWLFTKHFDAGGLRESEELRDVWPVIKRAVDIFALNPSRNGMKETLTDEEIAFLKILSHDWFEFLVSSNVDLEKQTFRETAACHEVDWWLRSNWEFWHRAFELESPDEVARLVLDQDLRQRLNSSLPFLQLISDLGGYEKGRNWTVSESRAFIDRMIFYEIEEDDDVGADIDFDYHAEMFSLAEKSCEIIEQETYNWIYAEQTVLHDLEEAENIDHSARGFAESGPNLHTICDGFGPISLLPLR